MVKQIKKDNIIQITKNVKVKFKIVNKKKPFIANGGILGIEVDDYFLKNFTEKEQKAILMHESFHKKYNWLILLYFEIKHIKKLLFFSKNKYNPKQLLEFEADKWAVKNFNKKDVLSMLFRLKKAITKGFPYNLKSHPPIDDRIKRIKNLKENEL